MQKVKKSDFINGVAAKVEGVSKKTIEEVINASFAYIAEQMADGKAVPVSGFGTFETKIRPAREALNPLTKEKIQLSEKVVPVFKASKALKEKF